MSELLQAIYQGDQARAEELLAVDPELDVFEAAAVGRTDRVRELLDQDPSLANAWGEDGFQPLGLASFFGHVEAARLLVERGAEVNSASRNEMKVMPLHSAAAADDPQVRYEIAKLLLEAGGDPNARQQDDFTPLMAADRAATSVLRSCWRNTELRATEEVDEQVVEARDTLDRMACTRQERALRVQSILEHVADGLERGAVPTGDDELRERRCGQSVEGDLGLPRSALAHHRPHRGLDLGRKGGRGVVLGADSLDEGAQELLGREVGRPQWLELGNRGLNGRVSPRDTEGWRLENRQRAQIRRRRGEQGHDASVRVADEVVARLEYPQELLGLVLEIDPCERRIGRISASGRHDERVALCQRALRGPAHAAAGAVDEDDARAGAGGLDIHVPSVQARPVSAKPCGFSLLQGLLCSGRMEPSRPTSFQPAGAGALLIGTTSAGIGVGALIGWGAGSAAIGALVGAVFGIPASIFVVYRRYRGYFT
jgi:hypothetical protein